MAEMFHDCALRRLISIVTSDATLLPLAKLSFPHKMDEKWLVVMLNDPLLEVLYPTSKNPENGHVIVDSWVQPFKVLVQDMVISSLWLQCNVKINPL